MPRSYRVLLLPLHRAIASNWGSEIGWAIQLAHELADLPELDLTAVVGHADATSASLLRKSLNLVELGTPPGYTMRSTFRFYGELLRQGPKLIRNIEPDVVHHVFPMGLGSGFNPLLLSGRTETPYVVGPILFPMPISGDEGQLMKEFLAWEQTQGLEQLIHMFRGPLQLLHRLTLRNTSHLFFDCLETRKGLLALFPGAASLPFTVVPGGGVDTRTFRTTPLPESEIFTVGTLTYLRKRKNVDVLLRAVALLGNKRIHILIGGDGPERPTLQRLASELGVKDKVSFLGRIPHEEVPAFLSRMHVYWNGADGPHTIAASVQEALMCGRPIIATEPLLKELAVLPYGIAVPPRDPQQLASALTLLQENAALPSKLGQAGREFAMRYFSTTAIISKVFEVYRTVAQ